MTRARQAILTHPIISTVAVFSLGWTALVTALLPNR